MTIDKGKELRQTKGTHMTSQQANSDTTAAQGLHAGMPAHSAPALA